MLCISDKKPTALTSKEMLARQNCWLVVLFKKDCVLQDCLMTWMSSDTTLFLRGQTVDLSSKYAFLILYSIVELGSFRE